jgi:hypothetical protein
MNHMIKNKWRFILDKSLHVQERQARISGLPRGLNGLTPSEVLDMPTIKIPTTTTATPSDIYISGVTFDEPEDNVQLSSAQTTLSQQQLQAQRVQQEYQEDAFEGPGAFTTTPTPPPSPSDVALLKKQGEILDQLSQLLPSSNTTILKDNLPKSGENLVEKFKDLFKPNVR